MNNRKKNIFIVVLGIIISVGLGYRYIQINKDIPKSYEKQSYNIQENINLDDLKFVVKSYSINKNGSENDDSVNVDFSITLGVENKSNSTIDATPIIFNSKLATEFQYQDSPNISNKDIEKLKNLKKGEKFEFTVSYSMLSELVKDKDTFKFYIANELYKNEIMEKYKESKLYSKYVELKL